MKAVYRQYQSNDTPQNQITPIGKHNCSNAVVERLSIHGKIKVSDISYHRQVFFLVVFIEQAMSIVRLLNFLWHTDKSYLKKINYLLICTHWLP